MRRAIFLALLAAAMIATGCGRKKVRAAAPAHGHRAHAKASQPPRIPPADYAETGLASWYGYPYHGRPAANGEIYDMEQMTAAHRTLPFNTMVRVENTGNSKTVDVRITDRGPFINGRIIDLSHAAALAIDLIGPGVAAVRLSILAPPKVMEPELFGVQIGAFRDRANADRLRDRMESTYGAARVVARAGTPELWRVVVGRSPDTKGADELAARIRQEQSLPQAFVVRLD